MFAAESAVYKSRQAYLLAVFPQADGSIHPAQRCVFDWYRGAGRPVRDEGAFVDCMVSCQSQGGTYHGCQKTCCCQATGSYYCYVQ